MLDFILRRGNITNRWQRTPHFQPSIDLALATINGVELGSRISRLEFLGRSSRQVPALGYPYRDIGLALEADECGKTFTGFHVIIQDDEGKLQPFSGLLMWKQQRLQLQQLSYETLTATLGECYWLDLDEGEMIAFYELQRHEVQFEFDLTGKLKWISVTDDPLMTDAEQRAAYGVDKAWPPSGLIGGSTNEV